MVEIDTIPSWRSAAGLVRRLRRASAAALLVAVTCSPAAVAETLYVTDILRLGLHESSDTSDRPFRVLVSGDALEVIERSQFYARVRTADGDEGFVKVSYLVDEKPAKTMMTDLTNERDRLAAETAELRARLEDQNGELASLRADRDDLERNAETVANELSLLRTTNDSLAAQVSANRLSVPIHWLLAIAAAMLVGGFVGGWYWTDARQRARHGGFRI